MVSLGDCANAFFSLYLFCCVVCTPPKNHLSVCSLTYIIVSVSSKLCVMCNKWKWHNIIFSSRLLQEQPVIRICRRKMNGIKWKNNWNFGGMSEWIFGWNKQKKGERVCFVVSQCCCFAKDGKRLRLRWTWTLGWTKRGCIAIFGTID